jgi:hypothetical protein
VPLSSVFLYYRFKDELEEEIEPYDKGESEDNNDNDKGNVNKVPSTPAVTPSERVLIANTDANRIIAEVDGSGENGRGINGGTNHGDSSTTASKSNSNGNSSDDKDNKDGQQLATKQEGDLENNHQNDKNYIKNLDLESMIEKNSITNLWMLLQVSVVGVGIVLALFLSPVHKQEAAWFTFLGMLVF